jgi:hypothetical protein
MLRMRLLQNVFDVKKDFHDDYRAEIQSPARAFGTTEKTLVVSDPGQERK